jgi:hypothetical protein
MQSPDHLLRRLLILLSAVAAAGTMLVSLAAAAPSARAAAGTGTGTYQVLDNGQKSALDLKIMENFVPYAETFWRTSNIADPDTGYFLGTGAGVAQPRGDGDTDYVYATLLTALPKQQSFDGVSRATMLDHLIRSIRYTALTNVYSGAGYNTWGAASGPGSDGEFSLETYSWGGAAYLIWNQLDPGTKALVEKVVSAEANLVASLPPVDAVTGNTGGETDAWDAPTPALAAVMFPDSPDRATWEKASIEYALNSSSMPGDETSSQVVDGEPLSDWVTTDNIHSDLTLENHGYFNIDYQMVAHLLINDAAIFYAQGGIPQPQAFSFRTNEIWQKVIEPLTTDDGDLISPAGQDWASKDYQWLDYLGEMATRFGSPAASVLESRALQLVAARQAGSGNDSITGMTQLGYEAMLARRISADWWDHKLFPPSPTPSEASYEASYGASGGVHTWPDVDVISGRLSGADATMSWDSESPMGTWSPRTGNNMTDPAFTEDAPGSLFNTARGTTAGPYTCACGTDQFATAGTVGSKNLAMAAFPDGTTLLLDQGTGPTFTYSADQIPGMTGPRPVYSAGGTGIGSLSGSWVDVAGKMAMIVAGGSGISAADAAPGSNFDSNDTPLNLTGSTGTGSGNRGAELVPNASSASAASLADDVTQPSAPAGWGALQAQDPDGADLLAVARWSGAQQATFSLTDDRGAPVTTQTATVTGSTASVDIPLPPASPGDPGAVQETIRYFVDSSGPFQVRQAAGGSEATLSNPGTSPVTVTVTYVSGNGTTAIAQRTLAGGETTVARMSGRHLITAGPEYEPIVAGQATATALAGSVSGWQQSGQISAAEARSLTTAAGQISGDLGQAASASTAQSPDTGEESTLVADATTALARIQPVSGMPDTVTRVIRAFRTAEAADLAKAGAALRVTLLAVPDGQLQQGEPATFTVYALNRGGTTASSGQLSLSLTDGRNPASTAAFTSLAPGASATVTVRAQVPSSAAPWSDQAVKAALSYTASGGPQHVSASAAFSVAPLMEVTPAEPDLPLAAGGWNQETYTVANYSGSPLTVTLAGQVPAGVTATTPPASVSVPADGTTQVNATVTNADTSSGSGTLTLTATAANGVTSTATSRLEFSDDLAFNPYGAPWPQASASSSQASYPPAMAIDGDTQTSWVSGGPATAGSGPTPQDPVTLGVDFGAPVTIGSVTMTPRPGYGPTDYSIQTSTDGQNWTTLTTVTSAAGTAVTTAVPATTAQWLRLVITGSNDATDRNVQVAELAVMAPESSSTS